MLYYVINGANVVVLLFLYIFVMIIWNRIQDQKDWNQIIFLFVIRT